MRKLSLTVIGMYIGLLSAFSQPDSSAYKSRKLKTEEINFVSGYYHQNGNNSAVTGGIGTEKLTDFANTLELKLSKYDRRLRKHSLTLGLGVDHYSSASSDKIDPNTISSASSADTRIYPSVAWSIQNEVKRTTFGLNTSFSKEYDYTSIGFGASFTKTSHDNNREFTAKGSVYLDHWKVILPVELRADPNEKHGPSQPRNSYNLSLDFSQVVNRNLQLLLIAEPTYQRGLLATKYQRVYFNNGGLNSETLPDTRLKLPVGIRANYFAGDKLIIRSFYRYYQDDWGIRAHTIDLETTIKITPFFSVSPFYRYYTQTQANYFAPFMLHDPAERFFTSDYDLSAFHSQFFGAGIRIAPPEGVFKIRKLNSVELRYGHYTRSNGLKSDEVSLHVKIK